MKACRQCRYFYHGHKGEPTLCTNRHSKKFPSKISRDGHDHVCALFRPIKKHNHFSDPSQVKKKDGHHDHSDSILSLYRGKLKFIENLRGIYAGREIWILATGPSIDDIPHDFLQVDETISPDENGNTVPKLSIAVKEATMLFPDCTYNLWTFRDRSLRHKYLPRHQVSSNFSKFIFTIRNRDRENYHGKEILKPIYLRYGQHGTLESMKSMCESIVASNSSIYYGVETIMHLAIAAALVMGATKISLVGCDHGAINGRLHFQMIEIEQCWPRAVIAGYEIMRPGTNFLADYFRDHGVEIVRYYHGKGYEPIGKAMEEFASEEIKEA